MKGRGWRKKRSVPETMDPIGLQADLQSRVLSDLDRCRIAWQQADDPMALAVAVTQADLPDWLVDGLLLVLTDTEGNVPLAELWRDRRRDMTDRHRTTAAVSARTLGLDHGLTWDQAYTLGEHLVRENFADAGSVTPAAIKKSHQTVVKNLSNQGRYHLPPTTFRTQMLSALEREVARLKASSLARSRKRGTQPAS
jgi:hypothetical protein